MGRCCGRNHHPEISPAIARAVAPAVAPGFTLVEVLVVIGVIGLLMSLVLPAMSSLKNDARSTQCLNNLRQLAAAVQTSRQSRKDQLPYAAPLPVAAGQTAVVPGLPETLKAILPADSETWMCPADLSQDSEDIGSSYLYVPGAFMLLEPPLLVMPPLSENANIQRVSRLITERFSNGYLRGVPILSDSGEYHANGNRNPRNGAFLDGSARILKPSDGDIQPPNPSGP